MRSPMAAFSSGMERRTLAMASVIGAGFSI
jgi:hypothetical protein